MHKNKKKNKKKQKSVSAETAGRRRRRRRRRRRKKKETRRLGKLIYNTLFHVSWKQIRSRKDDEDKDQQKKKNNNQKKNNGTHMLFVDVFILSMERLVCSSCLLVVSNTVSAPDVQLGAVDDVFVGHAFL